MKKVQRKARLKAPIEKVILFLAAGFAAYNFGLVGGYIEGTKFSIGGLIAGVVVNISIAIAASRYGSLKGDKRTQQARAAFYAMLIISPVLVSPVIFYNLPESFLGVWPLRAAWSVAWPLAADLAIVLAGAVSGKGLIALSDDNETRTRGTRSAGASNVRGSAQQEKRTAEALRAECTALQAKYACTIPNCGWSPSVDALIKSAQDGKSPKTAAASAKAGHVKNKHPKPIVIDQSLLIGNQQSKSS